MGCVLALDVDEAVAVAMRAELAPLRNVALESMSLTAGLRTLEAEPRRVEALVVGRGVPDPVQTAQRAFAVAPQLPVLILVTAQRLAEVRRAVQFAPLVGEQVRCVGLGEGHSPAETLRTTVERARQRSEYEVAVSAMNVRLAVRPPRPHPSRAEDILGRILARAPIGVVVVGQGGTVSALNAIAGKLLQASEQAAVGRPLAELFGSAQADRCEGFLARLDDAGAGDVVETFTGPEADPATEFEASGAPLAGRDGSPGYVVLLRDVTERNRLAASERRARHDAEDASRAKDEFLAMLGHELRNPLSPIVTALHLMKLRGGNPRFEREMQLIERQVTHLVRLVDDLLDVSRIARGRVELKRERVEVKTVIARAIEQVSPLMDRSEHRLEVSVPAVGLVVDADPMRLAQVIANLLTNSARYTARGGVVKVTARRVEGDVEVRVSDNGIGIAAPMLSRIFETFVQGERGIDRTQGGLGLGLAIARNLVTLHGGSVTAHSDGVNRGSEFVMRVPAVGEHAVERRSPPEVTRPTSDGGLRKILVVDDNVDAAVMLAEVLDTLGYEVRVAHDAIAGLALAETFRPAIAVLDIGLPGMDGHELARHLRARGENAGLRLIALTGYGQESDRAQSKAAGFEAHLVKPVDVPQLQALLEHFSTQAKAP